MSKYPVTYQSKSKGTSIAIEDMPTAHILNAWRKLMDVGEVPPCPPEEGDYRGKVIVAMNEELVARGCTYDRETGRWTVPDANKEERESQEDPLGGRRAIADDEGPVRL